MDLVAGRGEVLPLEDRADIVGEFERVVGPEHTATHLGSGSVDVLATPEMILWMEEASVLATNAALDAGQATVGTLVLSGHVHILSTSESVHPDRCGVPIHLRRCPPAVRWPGPFLD